MKRNYTNILIAAVLVLIAASARIANREMHLPNFAPLAALSLFSGAIIKDKRIAFLTPLLGQFIADVYFQLFTNTPGFYDVCTQLFNYGGLIAATVLGMRMAKPKPLNALAYTFGASTLFFLVSNLGVWAAGWYGYSFNSFFKTYRLGLPFFRYTFMGDMAGGILLFGTYFLLQAAYSSKMQKAKA